MCLNGRAWISSLLNEITQEATSKPDSTRREQADCENGVSPCVWTNGWSLQESITVDREVGEPNIHGNGLIAAETKQADRFDVVGPHFFRRYLMILRSSVHDPI